MLIKSKICRKCNNEWSLSLFNKDKRRKDGLYIYCKNCASSTNKASYKRRRLQIAIKNKQTRAIRNIYIKTHYHTNINYKLSCNLRQTLRDRLKGKSLGLSALGILGCSVEYLKQYLESKFQPGMSWNNWNREGWHIDHIKPLSSFDLTKEEEIRKASHFTNLQPLWAYENLSKNDRIILPTEVS